MSGPRPDERAGAYPALKDGASAAALAIVDQLLADGALPESHLLPTVRGELLCRLGRGDEARAELERAVALCGNERERTVLQHKITDLASQA